MEYKEHGVESVFIPILKPKSKQNNLYKYDESKNGNN